MKEFHKRLFILAIFIIFIISLFVLVKKSVETAPLKFFEELGISLPLPIFTLIIALIDGFNPCAFFVLSFLLALMVNEGSRKKLLIVGFVFVFISAFIYFLFMAAWLNFFMLTGFFKIVTTIAGLIALFVGLVNIKDFFFYKKGISFSMPEFMKTKLFKKMRTLASVTNLSATIIGTIILAVAANSYELLCTFGLPMIYTRILTLQNLPLITYYLYLLFYNIVYVIPLASIVLVFFFTLGTKVISEKQARLLKLISGLMMFCLGMIILFRPELLSFV